MPDLAHFQDAFGMALRGKPAALTPWLATPPADAPGLAVYKNTVAKGAIDALASVYGTIVRMVGEDWFAAAAAVYVEDHPPGTPSLLAYGADFADWLADFPPAQDAPYLPAVARLDRLWWDSYFAGDADHLDPTTLSGLTALDLETTTLHLHPSVRLAAFEAKFVSLWLAHRDLETAPAAFAIEQCHEQVLIARSGLNVEARIIDAAAYAFLDACRNGESLLGAGERSLTADPHASMSDIIRVGLAAGAFSRPAAPSMGKPR